MKHLVTSLFVYLCCAVALLSVNLQPVAGQSRQPNVILILTDDQGCGDLSLYGNQYLKTPNIDSIARDGAQFMRFHSSPVCSPTRSSLLTGRYNYRTGAVDTYLGRSMMRTSETA